MTRYTSKDLEEFLQDDDFFQWAKYGFSNNGFDINHYKQQHPGSEGQIDLAVAVIRAMNVVEDYEPTSQKYKEKSFADMMRKVQQEESQTVNKKKNPFQWKRVLIYTATTAALLLLTLGSYYFILQSNIQPAEISHKALDSLSQSNQVVVLLNGKQTIALDKNNAEILMDEKGNVIVDKKLMATSKEQKVSINQVVVPYGKRSKLILPDGTSLWINSGSSVSYGSDFCSNRELNVQGEVYLDVKKDKSHPFIVKTSNLHISVLGTAFNVTDYADEAESAVVLVRGSVNVKVDNQKNIRLNPNQRLSMDHKNISVSEVDVYSYVCWKDDIMNFCGQTLSFVLKSLSRYYDVKIEATGSLKEEKCYGSLDLNRTLDEVLESISQTTPMNINREENVIYISPTKK